MRLPSIDALPVELACAARSVARELRGRGFEAWIVGGAVRDLALGRDVREVDLATDAIPDEIEAAFPRTHAVGRAFGTVIVLVGDVPVEVTTFRSEDGYSDARRPDEVRFGATIDEDAERRDFTCNALYLDPLTEAAAPERALRDPVGGLADLEAGVLRCVGDPARRFAEDGLRLLRLARFRALFGFRVDPATWKAALAAGASLAGVSGERLAAELETVFERRVGRQALETLAELRLVERLFPGLPGPFAGRLEALGQVDERGDPALSLATWFEPDPAYALGAPELEPRVEAATQRLLALRPSRARVSEVRALWRVAHAIAACAEGAARAGSERSWNARERADGVLLRREAVFGRALALAQAWASASPAEPRGLCAHLRAWAERAHDLAPEDVLEPAWITSADLARAGLAPGPAWGRLLALAERAQLERRFADPEGARAWLAAEIAVLCSSERGERQDGGK